MGYHKLPSWTYFYSNEPDFQVLFASSVIPKNLSNFPSFLNIGVCYVIFVGDRSQRKVYYVYLSVKEVNVRYAQKRALTLDQRASKTHAMFFYAVIIRKIVSRSSIIC